ncbi:WAT1-related protein At3g28050-like [Neltuma alba]|uniref:WAT1-related protein At3g28050-like n=1 Tax=Neltuma alba TaxID=207710 RepID=UPI0010A551B1|nr:WAT1-related protein At3g28050-like [Prosopis alba]XP_028778632.1 WAT1-related protein At3g28050-like [Prosopis alba]XP_028793121.1 WAT1-related protein At3g28050-like [Prosopis alba]
MAKRHCYKDLLPFAALVTMECNNVGLNTLFKAATLKGMSYHVFVVYAYAVAAIVLLPVSFFSRRSRVLPPLSFSIFSRILLLGFIGCSSQIMGYTGISYSSPTLSSAISNLVPAFTFLLAIIFRMETIAIKSTSCQAKVLGTIVSISGAFVITLYKGPPIIITHAPSFSLHQPLNILKSVDRSWAIGGLLLTAEYILVTLWYIVQVQIMRVYPDELTVVFFYNLCVSIMAAVVGIFTEPNPDAWKIGPSTALASILCSGIFGSFVNNTIHTWALRIKGPLYVAMFKPLSIAIAVAMGVIFLGDTLHLGSLIGATIISIGFYTVMWGKSTEEVDENVDRVEPPTAENVPLLQGYETERTEKKMHANV